MICHRCGALMVQERDSRYFCAECEVSGMDISGHRGTKPKPTDAIPPARSGVPYPADPYGERLRKAEERLAKMESAVADLKRRTEPHAPVALRFLGQLAEEPSAGEPRETR